MKVLDEVRELFGMILDHSDQIRHVKLSVKMKNGAKIAYAFDRKKWERRIQKEQKERPTNDITSAIVDIFGSTVSVSVLVLLIVFSSLRQMPNYIIINTAYGSALVLYFLFSSIYHFMDETWASRRFFEMLRSVMQFIIIALSFMAVCYDFIGGALGSLLYFLIAVTGIIGLFLSGRGTKLASKTATGFLIAMTWLWVPGFLQIGNTLGWPAILFLLAASMFYTFWGLVSNRSSEQPKQFIAGNIYILLSIFPLFALYMRMLGVLPL